MPDSWQESQVYQGPKVCTFFSSGKSYDIRAKRIKNASDGKQETQYRLYSQRAVRTDLVVQVRGLGQKVIRQLEGVSQMAAAQAL